MAVGWSGYFVKLVGDAGLHLPDALVQGPFLLNGHEIVSTGALFNLPAAAPILFGGLVVTMGTSSVAQFGSVVVGLKLGVILLVIVFGLAYAQPANWPPFIPAPEIVGGASRYGR